MYAQIKLFQTGTDVGEQLGVTASMNKNLCGVGNTRLHTITGQHERDIALQVARDSLGMPCDIFTPFSQKIIFGATLP